VIRHQDGRLLYPSSEHALLKESQYKESTNLQSRNEVNLGKQKYSILFGKDDLPVMDQLFQLLKDQKEILFIFLLGITLLIYKVASYFLNFDVDNIIQWFKNRSGTSKTEILSRDAQRLKEFIYKIEQRRTQAEILVQEYRGNAYSGLTWAHEKIKAGVTHANIVVGRCDINGYTILKQKYSPELLSFVTQSFFNRGGEYLNRYGAYKESAAGDEITFFVPESESKNPHLNALHLIRGLFEIFEDLETELSGLDQPLTLKGSLDYGATELEEMGGNAETEGEPFIVTERILKTLDEDDKAVNILVILSNTKDRYQDQVIIHHESSEKVKNYANLKNVAYIKIIKSYIPVNSANLSASELQYFRTDNDITNILKDMTAAIDKRQRDLYNVLRTHLVSLKITRTNKSVVEQFNLLFEVALKTGTDNLISDVAILAKSLLSSDSITESILAKLKQCLLSKNKRVVSNARETIFQLRPNLINLQEYTNSEDNRIAADSLVDLIKLDGLTDHHTEILLGWLASKNKNFQLSALYAVYKSYRHWIETRPDYVTLNHNFKKIDSAVHKMDRSDNSLLKWIDLYYDLKKATAA
jgi:hypothetical protein